MVINEKINKKQKTLVNTIEPKYVKDFHNQNIANEIRQWICQYENKNTHKKALLIHGKSGIGKTLLVKILLKELGYHMYYFDSSIARNKKWVNDVLVEVVNSKGFFIKRKIVVIDDMDAFTNTNDYGGISEIIKLINPLKGMMSVAKVEKVKRDSIWKIPIIFICNNVKSNKFTDLTKECDIIEFPIATTNDLYKISKKCKCLKKDVYSFIQHCNGDIRFFLNNIQFYGKNINVSKTNTDSFIYDRLSHMFENPYDDKSILLEFYHDQSMFPSLVNENIYQNMDPHSNKNLSQITQCISDSDLMLHILHNKVNDIEDIYAYMSVIYPIYLMKEVKKTKVDPIKFPVILGKNAVIYGNKVAFFSFYKNQYSPYIDHFVLLRKTILSLLVQNDTIKQGVQYMLTYNITPEEVFSSVKLKVFQNTEYKLIKNAKHKKLIKSLYLEYK